MIISEKQALDLEDVAEQIPRDGRDSGWLRPSAPWVITEIRISYSGLWRQYEQTIAAWNLDADECLDAHFWESQVNPECHELVIVHHPVSVRYEQQAHRRYRGERLLLRLPPGGFVFADVHLLYDAPVSPDDPGPHERVIRVLGTPLASSGS